MSLTKVKAGNILLTTPGASSNDTTPATTQYVTTAIGNLVDTAPSTLNTLNELAAALGDDVNFSTTVTNSIATKLPLAGGILTGNLKVDASFTVNGNVDTSASLGEVLQLSQTDSVGGFLWSVNRADGAYKNMAYHAANQKFYRDSSNITMTLASSGNVGIGTTGPNSKLMVIDTGDSRKQIEFGNHVTYRGSIGHDASSGRNEYRTEAGGGMHAFFKGATSTTPEMIIDNNGKVGIGTTSPTHGLTVSDINGGDNADMRRITIKSETHGANSGFRFDSESGNGTARGGGYYFQPGNTDTTTYLGLSATDAGYQMVITRDGLVGIGGTPMAAGTFTAIDSGTSNGGIRTRTHSSSHYTNVVTAHTQAGSSRYWHIKTNIQATNYVMFVARVHGYSYGNSGHIVDVKRSGYAHTSAGTVAGSQTVNNGSSSDTLDWYYAGNYLCFKWSDPTSGYYTGLSFDIHLPSPTGYNFNFQVTANVMNNVSGSHYT